MPESDVVSRIKLAPDAGLVHSLGSHHTFESAVADLIDNSVDAGASKVLVRLLTREDQLVRVEVMDDGRGMTPDSVTEAMTIGHRRCYTATDLGHFGMGLKAASFAHGDTLTVWSTTMTADAVGRRIRRSAYAADFSCEVLTDQAAARGAELRHAALGGEAGTTVVWTDLRNSYRGTSVAEARAWLNTVASTLRTYLGVVFHRLLENQRLDVDVAVDEVASIDGAAAVPVIAIDPFGYHQTGHTRYPKDLVTPTESQNVTLRCHVWPARADLPGFRIGTKSGEQFQGFFIYRNQRLLQLGGWSGVANPTKERQLARVALEDLDVLGPLVTMNPEKSGMKFEPAFHDAVNHAAAADGTTFLQYLTDAEGIYSEAHRRRRRRSPAITPDKGFAPALRRTIRNELPMIEGDALNLQWTMMPGGDFLDIDLHTRTLWLNSRYRSLFAPERGSLNDAPVLKALLYLLTHHVFEGQRLGAKDKDEIALWKSVLGAAAETEQRMRDGA